VAILLTTGLVHLFDLPVATIGQRFGSVDLCLPCIKLPQIELSRVLELVSPAIAIALLAGIESLLSAVVADGMTGRRHRSDMELISQGIANIGSALLGGLPATGAIARTAANIKSGAVSPISTIVHALTLLLLLLFLGSYVTMIPMAALSALLVFVAYNMSEWRHFVRLFRSPPGDVAVLLLTFFLTVFVDLVTAIEVGVIFAAFLFIYRMSQATHVKDMKELIAEQDDPRDYQTLADLLVPDAVQVFEVFGSLSFGAVESFEAALQRLQVVPKVLILRMRHVLTLDATGIRALTNVLDKAQRDKTTVLFTGVHPRLLEVLVRCGIAERIGPTGIQPNLPAAVTHAKRLLK
jgi:SulP family sulfate permease